MITPSWAVILYTFVGVRQCSFAPFGVSKTVIKLPDSAPAFVGSAPSHLRGYEVVLFRTFKKSLRQ